MSTRPLTAVQGFADAPSLNTVLIVESKGRARQ